MTDYLVKGALGMDEVLPIRGLRVSGPSYGKPALSIGSISSLDSRTMVTSVETF
jgi:hypothetical protein